MKEKIQIKSTEYAARRKKLMQKIGPHGVLILAAAPMARRNNDSYYPYRQNSDFYYLTGFKEPEAVMVLLPKRKEGEFILFNRPRIREEEIWTGVRAGAKGACKIYGADSAYSIAELSQKLPELLEGRDVIYHTLGIDPNFDQVVLNAFSRLRGKVRTGTQSPIAFADVGHTIHEMRLIKSPAEIKLMRYAAQITAKAHIRAMKFCQPGVNEYELEAEIMHEFQRHGAKFPAYNPIIGSHANSCILHYDSNDQRVADNSIVLIDAGCEYEQYAADVTRTFPANGRFSNEQRALYEIVLAAQKAAIKTIKPGAKWPHAQETIIEIITEGLRDLGILKGKLATLIEQKAYAPFYMHNSGHWLGLDVHDVGRYKAHSKWRSLEAGMVLTVEPGIYISADATQVDKRWHNIGIRIEDDILVTKENCAILSDQAPKEIADIEALMRA